ncbi:MAG TPA: EutN/CcmL family microcompartment protein [Pirellulales bacterium]|jgi:ethanolamine utilization protein EutN|nr:EutN/CcmL family microcompartment protein [Pirellulales bacterium]
MRIATIIGTVTLSRSHPTMSGASFRLAVPLSLANLTGAANEAAEELVVYDELGSGIGSRIALSEGGEAAQPFRPEIKPVDAYNAAVLDQVEMETETTPGQWHTSPKR